MTRQRKAVAFDDALALFRMREQPEQVVALLDDLPLQKLVAVWPDLPLTAIPITGRQPPAEDLRALWEWLWRHRQLAANDLARALGLSTARAQALFEVARRQRLIYPDGTVHGIAAQYLRARFAVEIGGRPPAKRTR